MKVLISTQSKIEYDGKHYYGNSIGAAFKRYYWLGNITFICHKKDVKQAKEDRLDDDIRLVFTKRINTVKSILKKYSKENDKIAEEQVKNSDVVIVHTPSDNGYQVIKYCKKYNKPYMTVVCGCAWDALWNHGWRGKILAPLGFYHLKKSQCDVPYSIYVTNVFLQKRYPTKGKSIGCSNVNISTGISSVLEKRLSNISNITSERVIRICTAAAIDVPYKGQEYVIRAMAQLKKIGIRYEYHLIGSGNSSRLRKIAEQYEVIENVIFHGVLPHEKVLDFLDKMDIYIQPSKQEGLPRALIEAMSRGCLCIGSRVAGIPELLEKEYLFSKGNITEIVNILSNITIEKIEKQAIRNFEFAKNFDSKVLNGRRENFIKEFLRNNNLNIL